jgi:hypothetical protein
MTELDAERCAHLLDGKLLGLAWRAWASGTALESET